MDSQTADGFVGKTVRQYAILGKLGGGGMGVVYAARDTRLGRPVALKFLPHQWCHDENAKQRFIREAQAASSTDHPNICTIHDIESTDDGQLFIVMAHYQGQTLKQRLEAGPLLVDEAVEAAAQVAEGLAKAHAQGVVHRDIKPGNLMMTDDGVRILDFGLAKLANSLQLTIEGSTLGTIAYMSPEQIKGEEADARADVWAVGVVLYEMLSGTLPFKGGYPEAIAHAIKNNSPAPLRAAGRDIPEELEQAVFRALHKDPRIRFQSARDLARALRRLQGRTIPLDLRTEPLPPLPDLVVPPPVPPWWKSRAVLGTAAGVVAALVGLSLWFFSSVDRVFVVVAPVVNQTGYAELDPYRLALTQELVSELRDSPLVRVLPYERLLQIVRRFRDSGEDVSSRDAIQALTVDSGAQILIVPTLLYENGAWKAQVEFRRADTATNEGDPYQTPSVVSSLVKDTAYGLVPQLAGGIQNHFLETGPLRASLANALKNQFRRRSETPRSRMGSLDAAAAFGEGLEAYSELEYAAALKAFASASQADARNPLPLAWQSRVARIMRRDDEAAETADRALRLLSAEAGPDERRFVEAVGAESARNLPAAESRYRELSERRSDDPYWKMELAAFQDRQAMNAAAIATYIEALEVDPRLVQPHVELCRLYNRTSESVRAKEEGQRALSAFRALGDRGGEAQALLCLTDTLRSGSEQERHEAQSHASSALEIFRERHADYNLARAYHYLALIEGTQGSFARAAASWEQSLEAARLVGNRVLQSVVLMNLGVAYDALGNRMRALDSFRESSKLHEMLGNEQQAAWTEANIGRILIEYGGNPEGGLRDVRNALGVFQKIGDKTFEVNAAQITASYYRNAGRHAEAEQELNRAIALARERNLQDEVVSATVDRAISLFDRNEYVTAREFLTTASANMAHRDYVRARLYLGRVYARMGSFDQAKTTIDQAAEKMQQRADPGPQPLLYLSRGELEYEAGRYPEARKYFNQASALWIDDLPDPASVEARCYVALLDALSGRLREASASLRSGLEQARRMARVTLETRCLLHLVRAHVLAHQLDPAMRLLEQVQPDSPKRTIGPELQAHAHFWLSYVLAARGDREAAHQQAAAVKAIIDTLRASLPEADRPGFSARMDIRSIEM